MLYLWESSGNLTIRPWFQYVAKGSIHSELIDLKVDGFIEFDGPEGFKGVLFIDSFNFVSK